MPRTFPEAYGMPLSYVELLTWRVSSPIPVSSGGGSSGGGTSPY